MVYTLTVSVVANKALNSTVDEVRLFNLVVSAVGLMKK
jgi:hypothetical protein